MAVMFMICVLLLGLAFLVIELRHYRRRRVTQRVVKVVKTTNAKTKASLIDPSAT